MSALSLGVAYICLTWALVVAVVQFIGISNLYRHFLQPAARPVSPGLPEHEVPHLTILRPVKGLETELYQCLASSFQQRYPANKLTVYLCIESVADPAYPTLQQLLVDFPHIDAAIFIESEDPLLHGPHGHLANLGPNPKIRNLSHAYRCAKGDLVWVVDANVWVSKWAAGRMVDKLCGFLPDGRRAMPYEFVHQVPLVVDVDDLRRARRAKPANLSSVGTDSGTATLDPSKAQISQPTTLFSAIKTLGGGRLEEMFMATTHAKFYGAINLVGIAPCIVGKSNMWRRSHLLQLTRTSTSPSGLKTMDGLDYFSRYICEDHMIGDILFRRSLPNYRKHGMIQGDVAIQPVAGMSIVAYVARRVRWLRARKWTVPVATLAEPGVESLLCCFYFAYAVTTIPVLAAYFSPAASSLLALLAVPSKIATNSWTPTVVVWSFAVVLWMGVDVFMFYVLHDGYGRDIDEDTPYFALGSGAMQAKSGKPPGIGSRRMQKRQWTEWTCAWLGREVLALPIWIWAVLLGATVNWRGRLFFVRSDMSVVEITPEIQVASPNEVAAPISNDHENDVGNGGSSISHELRRRGGYGKAGSHASSSHLVID